MNSQRCRGHPLPHSALATGQGAVMRSGSVIADTEPHEVGFDAGQHHQLLIGGPVVALARVAEVMLLALTNNAHRSLLGSRRLLRVIIGWRKPYLDHRGLIVAEELEHRSLPAKREKIVAAKFVAERVNDGSVVIDLFGEGDHKSVVMKKRLFPDVRLPLH